MATRRFSTFSFPEMRTRFECKPCRGIGDVAESYRADGSKRELHEHRGRHYDEDEGFLIYWDGDGPMARWVDEEDF